MDFPNTLIWNYLELVTTKFKIGLDFGEGISDVDLKSDSSIDLTIDTGNNPRSHKVVVLS